MEGFKSLGWSNKVSSCEFKALKINNTVEHDVNSVLEGFKIYCSTLAENLVKLFQNHPINTQSTVSLNIMMI